MAQASLGERGKIDKEKEQERQREIERKEDREIDRLTDRRGASMLH